MIVQSIKKKAIFRFKNLPVVMLEDKSIYHTIRRKVIAEKLNCRSKGYWIDRRFFTKGRLNELSERMNEEIELELIINCPF